MIRNLCGIHFRDVAVDGVTAGVVINIGLLRIAVPFAGEETAPADALEGHAYPPDAREKIHKCKWRLAFVGQFQRKQALEAEDITLGNGLIRYPVPDGAGGDAKMSGDIDLGVMAHCFGKITRSNITVRAGVKYGSHGGSLRWK